jgi:glycerol kinase
MADRAGYVLALDQGTTSSRAIVFDTDGRIVGSDQYEFRQHYPEPGWVEHDPEEIWDTQLRAARGALAAAQREAREIAAIGITNQRETALIWDRATGVPIYPAIVWQSRQTAPLCDALRGRGLEPLVRERTGLVIDAYFSATKARFILDAVEGAAERARRGELAFGTIDSWLIHRLTRGQVHATEASNASRTMVYNIHDQAWDPELLAALELPIELFAEVRDSSGDFGVADAAWLGAEIPIAGVAGDQQAALFGHGCFEEGEFKSTYGTGAFVWMNAGLNYRPVEGAGYLQTVAWSLEHPTYALEGFVMYAGAVLDWLVSNLGLAKSAGDVAAKAKTAGTSSGIALVPAFQGLASPWWEPEARAAVLGMSSSTRAEEICHAALESICYQVRRVLDDMADANVRPGGTVRADGGLTRSDYLLQMQADILGLPVQRAAMDHITPYGAGLLAGLGAGLWADTSALKSLIGGGPVYTPQASADWSRRYNAWSRAVECVLSWSKEHSGDR